jgi:hypothetical protein
MLRLLYRILFLLCFCCFSCFSVDFDVVVVGSSPIPLLEALYHAHLGKRVLVLEEAATCGGAWKSIEICGIYPVDLGCHTLTNDKKMLHFLEKYVGCHMVSMDNPRRPYEAASSRNGFYPGRGCYEIIDNLLKLIAKTDIVLLCNRALESVYIHAEEPIATIKTLDGEFTTSKILITPYTKIHIANPHTAAISHTKISFPHIYLLIEDPTPRRFSFRNGPIPGILRLMNLSYFAGLDGTSTQLIVLQCHRNSCIADKNFEHFFNLIKKEKLVDENARLLKADTYIYEQYTCNIPMDVKNASVIFEKLTTGHIHELIGNISRWEKVFPLFNIAISTL